MAHQLPPGRIIGLEMQRSDQLLPSRERLGRPISRRRYGTAFCLVGGVYMICRLRGDVDRYLSRIKSTG